MVEKADGAGFRGGGVNVKDVGITVDAREPVLSWLRVALPFSLMTPVDLLLECSCKCREEVLLAMQLAEPWLAMVFSHPLPPTTSNMTTA